MGENKYMKDAFPGLVSYKRFIELMQMALLSLCCYGFKLHIVINECGELLDFKLTPGNTDDIKPVPEMVRGLSGKIFGDRGYISQKFL